MNTRKIVITALAALVAFGAGYGLLGMSAPDPSTSAAVNVAADQAALQAVLASIGATGATPPNVIVLDAPPVDGSAGTATSTLGVRRGSHDDDHDDDRYEDHDDHDDHDDDRYDDDDD